jgi:hypothetical protein
VILVVGVVAVLTTIVVALGVVGQQLLHRQLAQSAADAVALAGVDHGETVARRVAASNGAQVLSYVSDGAVDRRTVRVEVRVGRQTAHARASNAAVP